MAKEEMERLRKITLKAIGCQPDFETLMAADGKRLDLCDIYGVATKAKPDESPHGPYVAFLGTFVATRLSDKAQFESNKIILPQFIEEGLYAAFGDASAGNVEFAIRISAKFDKESATKYVYDMRAIIKPQENAQLANLMERVKDAAKALPSPKLAPKGAAAAT